MPMVRIVPSIKAMTQTREATYKELWLDIVCWNDCLISWPIFLANTKS
jgi:hypothetical protein